jgi:hypothetical protein
MSKLFKILKKILFAAFFIYGYNILANPLNIIIPLNFITILYVSLFGLTGLFSLILIYIFSF